MKLWVARDGNDFKTLWLFENKPKCNYDFKEWFSEKDEYFAELPLNLLPEVTFENSPQRIELRLVDNETRR